MRFKVKKDFVYKDRVYRKGDSVSIAPSFETLSLFVLKGLVKVEERHFDEIWKDYADFLKTIEIIEEPEGYVPMEKDMLCLLRKEDLRTLSSLVDSADREWKDRNFLRFCQKIEEIKDFLGNRVYMKRKPLFKRPNASVSIIEKYNP